MSKSPEKSKLLDGLKLMGVRGRASRVRPDQRADMSICVRLSNAHYSVLLKERAETGISARRIFEDALLMYLEKFGKCGPERGMSVKQWRRFAISLANQALGVEDSPLPGVGAASKSYEDGYNDDDEPLGPEYDQDQDDDGCGYDD